MFESFGRFAAEWRAGRARRRTEMMLDSLSPEMQRDVGYTSNRVVIVSRGHRTAI